MNNAKTVIAILTAALAAGTATYLVKEREAGGLRAANEKLAADLDAVTHERDTALAETASQKTELSRQDAERADLLRLRKEVGALRQQTAELEKARRDNQQLRSQLASGSSEKKSPPPALQTFPRESWTFAGYASPEATLQSAGWGMNNGDMKAFLGALTPDERQRVEGQFRGRTEEEMGAMFKNVYRNTTFFSITSRDVVSPDETIVGVYEDGHDRHVRMRMKRIDNEWKMAGEVREAPAQQ